MNNMNNTGALNNLVRDEVFEPYKQLTKEGIKEVLDALFPKPLSKDDEITLIIGKDDNYSAKELFEWLELISILEYEQENKTH
jgi:hypothetical protein